MSFTDAERETPSVSIHGDIVVIADDGTMIADGRFVEERIMPVFYSALPDSFEFVNLFGASSFPEFMIVSAAAYRVRQEVEGLGKEVGLNRNGPLGIHTRRLQSIQHLRDIRQFGPTPTSELPGFTNGMTGVEMIGWEALHLFSCWINIDQIIPGADLLGRQDEHWNFFLNTDASVMEGCGWRDNGDGSFTGVAVLDGISELDEYLMGLRPATEVGPMFYIADPDPVPPGGDEIVPFPGFVTWGTRVDFTIDDVIAQNGPRVPDASQARHHFRMAFALIIPHGTIPPADDLAFLEQFRVDWESFFFEETESLGSMDTSLPRGAPHADFRADIVAGNPPLIVQFEDLSGGIIEERSWSFGDGAIASGRPLRTRVFSTAGTYGVRLLVRGPDGESVERKRELIRVGGFETVTSFDFADDDGSWAVGAPNDARSGHWEWRDPEGTLQFGVYAQPEDDFSARGNRCWVTGALSGSIANENDVDDGTTSLHSPAFDLSTCSDPYVSYARWYSNYLGSNSEEDVLLVEISADGGDTWSVLETVARSDTRYRRTQFRVRDFVPLSGEVVFRFVASDLGNASLVEAAIDDFSIIDQTEAAVTSARGEGTVLFPAHPNPFERHTEIHYRLARTGLVTVKIFDAGGRKVCTLEGGTRRAGPHEIVWDGCDATGHRVASGVYTLRIEAPDATQSQSLVLIR